MHYYAKCKGNCKGVENLREEQNILEIKVLGIATYIQTSVRRTARILSELHPVSKTAIWNWIKKFEEKLPISAERKQKSNSNR